MPSTPEWRKALRDLLSLALGIFLVLHETFAQMPRELVMYAGVVFIVGPGVFRSLGK